MNERDLYNAITDLPDDKIERAYAAKPKPRFAAWQKWTAVAAAAAVVAGAVWLWNPFDRPQTTPPAADPVPSATRTTAASSNQGERMNIQPLAAVQYPNALAADDIAGKIQVRQDNPVEDSFLAAVGDFSYRTAAGLLTESGNKNYSPLSLYYALAIAATGAEGDTADRFYALLGVKDRDELSAQCGNLYRRLYTDNAIGRLKIANSLWLDRKTNFNGDFVKNAVDNFYASTYEVDHTDSATCRAMEQWIADNTSSLLTPTVEPDPERILSIINTVYFYSEWQDRFQAADTASGIFHAATGDVTGEYMNATRHGSIRRGEGYLRSSLPLKNGEMVFVLPDEGVDVRQLSGDPEKLREMLKNDYEHDGYGEVVWQIPKFRFCAAFDPSDTLRALGLTGAFDPSADFSTMTDGIAYLSSIRQETTIGIDENGVEVAAFTQIDWDGASMPTDTAEMILDRPFLYGIYADGALLFVGVVEDPTVK